ncbi:MAG: hypothetical protein QXS79_04370 [Candidatus Bathyarchaeia archaeon]
MSLSETAIPQPKNFVLRITREEWLRRVFRIKKYYPGVPRRWEKGSMVFFARKSEVGDSLIGYGVIEEFVKKDGLSDKERLECEIMNWKGAIVFKDIYMFEPPVPIKETPLANLKARGKYLHSLQLTESQVAEIMEIVERISSMKKV